MRRAWLVTCQIDADNYAMMPPRAATTGLSRHDKCVRLPAAPAPPTSATATAVAGAPGHDPALAPRPARSPPRRRLPLPPPRPTANAAFDPRPGPTTGP